MTRTETRWALVSNTTVAPLAVPLKQQLIALEGAAEVMVVQYGEAAQQILQGGSALYAFKPDVVALYFDLDQLRPDLATQLPFESAPRRNDLMTAVVADVVRLVQSVRANTGAALLVNTFPVPPRTVLGIGLDPVFRAALRQANAALAEQLAVVPDCHVYDADSLWAEAGWSRRDRRFEMLAQLPFGPALQPLVIGEWLRYFNALRGRTRKCVVVDLDNTLWGGILGEDGPDGIAMADTPHGRPFRAVQAALKALNRRGVLLAVCSKNNPDDVAAVFRDHPDLLLREADFAAMRVNWEDKASNLRAIAGELNIGLQHFVFLDDNPAERQWVRQSLPEVLVPDLPDDPAQFADVLLDCQLDSLTVTEEDRQRAAMYAVERERRQLQATSSDFEQFLRELELVVRIEPLSPPLVERAAQLCQRTNQFNLTTRRHTAADLQRFAASPDSTVLMMNVRDRFGDYGWTGLAVARRDGARAEIDSFLVSCRVLGKRVELALFEAVAAWAREAGCTELSGRRIPTARNIMCAGFLAECGMTAVDGSETDYHARLGALPALAISHIRLTAGT